MPATWSWHLVLTQYLVPLQEPGRTALHVPVQAIQIAKIWLDLPQYVRVVWPQKLSAEDAGRHVDYQGVGREELPFSFIVLVHLMFQLVVEACERFILVTAFSDRMRLSARRLIAWPALAA